MNLYYNDSLTLLDPCTVAEATSDSSLFSAPSFSLSPSSLQRLSLEERGLKDARELQASLKTGVTHSAQHGSPPVAYTFVIGPNACGGGKNKSYVKALPKCLQGTIIVVKAKMRKKNIEGLLSCREDNLSKKKKKRIRFLDCPQSTSCIDSL